MFQAFLRTEFSEENLEFWLACEDFKKVKSQSKMTAKAKKIFAEYIAIQACKEVRPQAGPLGPPIPIPIPSGLSVIVGTWQPQGAQEGEEARVTLGDHVSRVQRKQAGALGRTEMVTAQAPVWQAPAKPFMCVLFYLT